MPNIKLRHIYKKHFLELFWVCLTLKFIKRDKKGNNKIQLGYYKTQNFMHLKKFHKRLLKKVVSY
jgi:hypothetical protein